MWTNLEGGEEMKCLNCGAAKLERFDAQQMICPYCQTIQAPIATHTRKEEASKRKHSPTIDFSGFEGSIVNLTTDQGSGTGFIIHSKGWVLTNQHVVNDEIIVHGTVGQSTLAYELEVIGSGHNDQLDLALLEILEADRTFPVIKPAQELPKIGDTAITLGNPRDLGISLSKGSVSRVSETVLQLDLTVNSGNSGGPVLNEHGECIGVISYKQDDVEGYGFAVPLSKMRTFLKSFNPREEG